MAHRVADELVNRLVGSGVKRCYGIVGDSLNPVTDSIHRNGKIKWIHVSHEETAAFAAGADAQLTGQLAVCAGSCGPGNLHLINGLFDAHRSNAPVLAIASHIPTSEIGTGFFQETHPEILFKECSHYCELISSPKQFGRVLHSAMQNAVGLQGVSVIVLPDDVAGMEMPADGSPRSLQANFPKARPCDSEMEELAEMINSAPKIALFCGIGCAGAHDEVIALADKLKAPVGHSYRGKPFIEYDNPFDVGMNGLLGFGSAYAAVHECDLLLLLGTDFPYEKFLPTDTKIVQLDIRPDRLGRRSRLDLGLIGDVGETIRALQPMVEPKSDRSFLDAMLAKNKEAVRKLNVYTEHVSKRTPMHPEPVAAALSDAATSDAIFTADTGMCNVWSARYLRSTKDRRILASYSHGSMANALPQAIGAQVSSPGRQVIAMCGDGGLAMLMGDLLTITQYDLTIKIVIFDNSALGMVKAEMEVAGFPEFGTDLKNPNFAKVAEAIGMMGVRIENPADVATGLREALEHQGPALVDVVTDPNALSLPPKISADQLLGFGITMGKLVLSGNLGEVADMIESNIRNL